MATTALKSLRQLRDYATAVLAVIDARGLEGATHITATSQVAHHCRDELEKAGHYLAHLLHELPHANGQEGRVLALPFDSLTIEQHSIAQEADGLLRDADMGLFAGESWEHRQHYGTTTVSPIVCRQLRDGIALLTNLVEPESVSTTWHAADATAPSDYPAGPLTGTKKQLAKWIMNDDDPRNLNTKLKNGVFWGREDKRNRSSVYFRNEKIFTEADRRRLAEQS